MVAFRILLVISLPVLAMPIGACGGSSAAPAGLVSPITAAGIQKEVHNSGAKVVLVNIWATWCAPCREEFPGLVRVAQKYRDKGLKVILVSADFDTETDAVKRFLTEQRVDFPTYIKAEKDQSFVNGLDKRWTGALPATFLYDGTGELQDFWEGKTSFNEFEQKVTSVLAGKVKSTGENQ